MFQMRRNVKGVSVTARALFAQAMGKIAMFLWVSHLGFFKKVQRKDGVRCKGMFCWDCWGCVLGRM